MTTRAALLSARRRLEAAGIESAPLEAEVLLRHALSTADPTLTGQDEKASQPAARKASDTQTKAPTIHPEPVEGRMLSRPTNALNPQPQAPNSHPEPGSPEPGRRVEGRALSLPTSVPVSRANLYAHLDEPLTPEAATRFENLLARRLAHEPTAYITGTREFYGLDFTVTPATLIPRPETEQLVEAAIALANRRQRLRGPVIVDVGTGSGAIAIALVRALPAATVYATDVSPAALAVARANARRHAVDRRIVFCHGDLLSPLTTPVDLIIANLPYVTSSDLLTLEPEVRNHEPLQALDGGPDGLHVIRRLLHQAPHYLYTHAALALEIGANQPEAASNLARTTFPTARIAIRNDRAGLPRVLIIET